LLVAMASALAAGPSLLKIGMANLRLAMPLALGRLHQLDRRRNAGLGIAR